jgi:hypothetical protein
MRLAPLPAMLFRYKDPRGTIVELADATWLAQAVREGKVTAKTPLAIGAEGRFRRAELVVPYQQVVGAMERTRLGPTTPSGAPPARVRRGSRARAGAAGVLALLALGVGYFVTRPIAPQPEAAQAQARAPGMGEALVALSTEFGDSIALRQRHLEQWVAAQRFDQRLEPRSLHSMSSLKGVRSAAARYRERVDSLVAVTAVLASRLALRADSLELADGTQNGLFLAAGAALRGWEGDLARYAELERATAATLDSLAAFLLDRQQSFVVRDGEPVFLSREDGARFRELKGSLEELARREQRWAEAMREKHPAWMTALAPADRPALRRGEAQRSNQ